MNIKNESFLISYFLNNYDNETIFFSDLFQSDFSKQISKALERMKLNKLNFSLESLETELVNLNCNDITYTQLLELKTSYSDFSNLDYHISVLKEDFNKNILVKSLITNLISDASSSKPLTTNEILKSLDLIKLNLVKDEIIVLKDYNQLMETYVNTLVSRGDKSNLKSSGFKCIDEKKTRPGASKEIEITAALRGSGKSAFKQASLNNLVVKGIPVLDISLEMSEESTIDRQMAMRTGISMTDLNKNSLISLENEKLKVMMEKFKTYNNYLFTDKSGLTFDEVDALITKAKKIFRQRNVFKKDEYIFVAIDVLNMIKDFGDQTPPKLLTAMDTCLEIAKKQDVHILGIVQINETKLRSKNYTDPSQLSNYRPNLEDIYGGSAYAQRARVVSILHRPFFLKQRLFPDMIEIFEAEEDILEYHCVKQNDGNVFTQKFIFDGERMRIIPRLESIDSEN